MLYTSNKVNEFPNFTKTPCKTCTWNVGIFFNERKYRWGASRFVMFWVSFLSLKNLMYNILKVSSFYREKVASCIIFSKLSTRSFSSRIRKNSPIGSAKVGASMVGGLFTITIMSCWRERFSEIGTRAGLLGRIPWCAMAVCSTAWKAVAMALA